MGLGNFDSQKDIQFCSAHPTTEGNFQISIKKFEKGGSEKMSKKTFKFRFPDPMGPSAIGQPAKTLNKGKGTNHQLLYALTEANEKEKEDENMWHMES